MNLLAWILVVVFGLAVVAFAYEALTERRERQRFPPPGRLVDVGGHRLHIVVTGEDGPGPTVIVDGGMVSFSSNWAWVQPELAKVVRVVACVREQGFQRPGTVWPVPYVRQGIQAARRRPAASTIR